MMDNRSLEEFSRYAEEFNKVITDSQAAQGLASLVMLQKEMNKNHLSPVELEDDVLYSKSRGHRRSLGVVSRIIVGIDEMSESVSDQFISKLRTTTLSVRLRNSIADLVEPLTMELGRMQLEEMNQNTQFHRENVLYLRQITEGLQSLGKRNEQSFMTAVLLGWRNFIRHPVWASIDFALRAINTVLVRPIFRTISGILFGFRRRQTDTDRIVNAIKEQTEFMRTGAIDRSQSMFQRLFRGGLIRGLGEGVLAGFGVSRSRAQQREQIQYEGGQDTTGITGRLSSMLYGGRILQYGRSGGILPFSDPSQLDDSPTHKIENSIERIIQILESHRLESSESSKTFESLQSISMDKMTDRISVQVGNVYEGVYSVVDEMKKESHRLESSESSKIERDEATQSILSDIKDTSELQAKETARIRRGQTLGILFSTFTRLATAISGFLTGSTLATLASVAIGAEAIMRKTDMSYRDLADMIGRWADDAIFNPAEWGRSLAEKLKEYGLDVNIIGLHERVHSILSSLFGSLKERLGIEEGSRIDRYTTSLGRWFTGAAARDLITEQYDKRFNEDRIEVERRIQDDPVLNELKAQRDDMKDHLFDLTESGYLEIQSNESLISEISELEKSIQRLDQRIRTSENELRQSLMANPSAVGGVPNSITKPPSEGAISTLMRHEGFRSTAYQDQAGIWTIGYGTTQINGRPVRPGDTITEEEAHRIMMADYNMRRSSVANMINVPVSEPQLDALTSLSYNIGLGAFRNSTLLKKLNDGDYHGAADEFPRWRNVTVNGERQVSQGLVNRRAEERSLFLSGMDSPAINVPEYESESIDSIDVANNADSPIMRIDSSDEEQVSLLRNISASMSRLVNISERSRSVPSSGDVATNLSAYGR